MKRRSKAKSKRMAAGDPTVEQVRRVRRDLLRRAGGTVRGYMRLMEELTRARAERGVVRSRSGRGKSGPVRSGRSASGKAA